MRMYAIKVEKLFGVDWKEWNKNYINREHEFKYNGVEYLPLDALTKSDYIVRLRDIEEIDINED